jgi:hypothetical protein
MKCTKLVRLADAVRKLVAGFSSGSGGFPPRFGFFSNTELREKIKKDPKTHHQPATNSPVRTQVSAHESAQVSV